MQKNLDAKLKIYIAGPMTGIEDFNFPLFFETEEKLKELGYETLNPAKNDGADVKTATQNAISASLSGATWSSYMRRDLSNLCLSDAVCVLPNWKSSKGASLEVQVAEALGMPIYTLKDGKLIPRVSVLGIAGWARSGKDTVADYLVSKYGYEKASFAAPMKEAMYRLNPKITINNSAVVDKRIPPTHFSTNNLRVGVDVYGWEELKERSPDIRGLLQRFGTEVGRQMFDEDFWVNYALHNIPDGSKVVIADVRYPNEADAIRKLGGKVVRVVRDGVGAANSHTSETAMDDYEYDSVITNNLDVRELYNLTDLMMGYLKLTDEN